MANLAHDSRVSLSSCLHLILMPVFLFKSNLSIQALANKGEMDVYTVCIWCTGHIVIPGCDKKVDSRCCNLEMHTAPTFFPGKSKKKRNRCPERISWNSGQVAGPCVMIFFRSGCQAITQSKTFPRVDFRVFYRHFLKEDMRYTFHSFYIIPIIFYVYLFFFITLF